MSSGSVGVAKSRSGSGLIKSGSNASNAELPAATAAAQDELVEETARLITEVASGDENTSGDEENESNEGSAAADVTVAVKEDSEEKEAGGASLFMIQLGTLIFYITADVMKNLAENLALKGSIINASWLLVMYSIVNLFLAPAITAVFDGKAGLKRMVNLQSIKNFCIPAILFGLQSCMMVLQNKFLPASTKKVLSQIRIPLTAVFSMFLTGAKYTGLQWMIIMMILCGIVLFQVIASGGKSIFEGDAESNMPVGLMLALIANLAAVLGSLTSERFLKAEKGTPFYMQKFQIEVTQLVISFVCYIAIVPYVIGGLWYLINLNNPDKRDSIMKSQSPFYWRQDIATYSSTGAFPMKTPNWQLFDESTMSAQEALLEISSLRRKLSMWPELDLLKARDPNSQNVARTYATVDVGKFNPFLTMSTEKEGAYPSNEATLHKADIDSVRDTLDEFNKKKDDKKELKKFLEGKPKTQVDLIEKTYWQTDPKLSGKQMFSALNTLSGYAKKQLSFFTSYPYGNKIVTAYENEINDAFTLSIPAVKKRENLTKVTVTSDKSEWTLNFESYLHGCVFKKDANTNGWFSGDFMIKTKFMETSGEDVFKANGLVTFSEKTQQFLFQISGNKVYVHFNPKDTVDGDKKRKDGETFKETPKADAGANWKLILDCTKGLVPEADSREPMSVGQCRIVQPSDLEVTNADPALLKYSNVVNEAAVTHEAGVTPGKYGAGSEVKSDTVCDEESCKLADDHWYMFSFMGCWTKATKFPYQYKGDDKNPALWGVKHSWTRSPFAGWNGLTIVAMFFNICQSWSSGLIVKVLSSLMKNISAALALVLIILIEYLVMWSPQKQASVSFFNLFVATCGVFLGAVSFVLAPKPPKDVIVEEEKKEEEDEEGTEGDNSEAGEAASENREPSTNTVVESGVEPKASAPAQVV